MKKILMVCLGNICRSPMAEGILRKKLEENNITALVDSAGTSSYHIGEHPDNRAVNCMKNKGINISHLKARQFSHKDYKIFDYIFVMDNHNMADVLLQAETEQDKEKVQLILNLIFSGKNMPVPDPYYGGDSGFETVYELLDKACDQILIKINS
jgi:protein-tyrosine phosphatase